MILEKETGHTGVFADLLRAPSVRNAPVVLQLDLGPRFWQVICISFSVHLGIMAGEAAKGTMGIFIIFVLSRALHPMVIDYSKVTLPVVLRSRFWLQNRY